MDPQAPVTTPTTPVATPNIAQPNPQTSQMGSQFQQAIQKAQQDPTSAYSLELMNRIKGGQMNDYLQAAGYDPAKFVTPPPQTPSTQPQDNGFMGLKGVAAGADKQIASLPFNIANAGKEIGNAMGNIPGLGYLKTPVGSAADKSTQVPQALQPNGTPEQIGNIGAQVGEFFLPGGAEASAGKGADALINSLDFSKIADTLGSKAPDIIKGILKVGSQGAITGTSMAGITATQTGGNVQQTGTAGVIGSLAGGTGKALEMVAPGIASALEKANFKLSPAKATQLGQKANDAASFISDNGIAGTTASKATKLNNITGQMESAIKSSIPDATVPRDELVSQLNSIPDQFKGNPATYQKVKSDVASAITTLQETQPKDVNLADVLSSKRSYGSAAYNKDGSAMIKESKMAISNVFYNTLDDSLKANNNPIQIPLALQKYFGGATELPIKDFNATYSKAVKASQLTSAAANKKDMGLVTRLLIAGLGTTIGAKEGGTLGAVAGAAAGLGAEELGSSGLTSLSRTALGQGISTAASTIPSVAKVGMGIANQNQNPQ